VSAPVKAQRCRAPEGNPAPATTPIVNTDPSRSADPDEFADIVVRQVDWSLWLAIRNGDFRLAVKCRRCGRWVTAEQSRRRHMGPRCAAKGASG
jgi:hypothetical protein